MHSAGVCWLKLENEAEYPCQKISCANMAVEFFKKALEEYPADWIERESIENKVISLEGELKILKDQVF